MRKLVQLQIPFESLLDTLTSLDIDQLYQLKDVLNRTIEQAKYNKLRDLLASKKWVKAEQETAAVMWKISGSKIPGFIHGEYIKKIPCEDLQTIDNLWTEYSNGHFGFSVQRRIWNEIGGKPYDTQDFKSFMKIGRKFDIRVGWNCTLDSIQFSLNAPPGHLPTYKCVGVNGGVDNAAQRYHQYLLATKLLNCKKNDSFASSS